MVGVSGEEGRAAGARARSPDALTPVRKEPREQDAGREPSRLFLFATLPFFFFFSLPLLLLLGGMSACRAAVLLCAALALSRARRSSPEQEDVQEKISSARCASRCLSLHMTQLTAAFRHLQVPAEEKTGL